MVVLQCCQVGGRWSQAQCWSASVLPLLRWTQSTLRDWKPLPQTTVHALHAAGRHWTSHRSEEQFRTDTGLTETENLRAVHSHTVMHIYTVCTAQWLLYNLLLFLLILVIYSCFFYSSSNDIRYEFSDSLDGTAGVRDKVFSPVSEVTVCVQGAIGMLADDRSLLNSRGGV